MGSCALSTFAGQVAAGHHDVIIPCGPRRLTKNVKHT